MIYKIKPDNTREVIAPDGEIVEISMPPNELILSKGPIIAVNISQPKSVIEKFSLQEKLL